MNAFSDARFWRIATGIGVAYSVLGAALLAAGRRDYPDLHTVLDTGMCLLSGVVAWLLWEMGVRIGRSLPKWLAVSFGVTSLTELVHVIVTLEWSGPLAWIARAERELRPSTWPVSAHILPIGVICAVWVMRKDGRRTGQLALGLMAVAVGLTGLFYSLPRYTSPTWLGITRPALIAMPFLWVLAGFGCWRFRAADRVLPLMVPAAGVMVIAHVSMLYSRAPDDTEAMVAHLGRVSAYLSVLLSLMSIASSDIRERIRAEEALARSNEELDERVRQRTAQLLSANDALSEEMLVRQKAEKKVQANLRRLNLLHQITRAVGERQDLKSIFQVVVRSVEDDLPADFSAMCLYDETAQMLEVAGVGVKSDPLATELTIPERSRIAIDQNGLSHCVRGHLIYEPDIVASEFPFSQRLARVGLRSLVMAPLVVESSVFGVLVAARLEAQSFSSGECEFLRQLSEHTALAGHQAQLHATLQRAYEDLRQTQQAVMQQERLRALGEMASGIAHDINNAIMPIAMYAGLVGKETHLSDRGRHAVEIIQKATADVSRTIDRLREFYRGHDGQAARAPVQMNDLVTQVVDMTRARWSDMPQQRGVVIRVVRQLAKNLPRIIGVENEIREALINLVFNAVDAMPNGGTVTLRTSVEQLDSPGVPPLPQVVVEVDDTGIGMDAETRSRCLEPFFTTKGEHGTGLGLAMVYGIMQRHGVAVEIDSAPGKGTTIRLSFPVASETVVTPAISNEQRRLARLRVLLIDDDPLVLGALTDTLEAEGHIITAANGGTEGIDAFRAASGTSERFDIVISDLGMPYIDGRQVASAIKAASPLTPIILLTGWGQRLMSESELPPHIDCVLSKPPTVQQLLAAFEQLTTKQ